MQRGHGLLEWEVENLHIGNYVHILSVAPVFGRAWLGAVLEKVVMLCVGCCMDVRGGA